MNKKLQITKYIIADVLSAIIAWSIFFIFFLSEQKITGLGNARDAIQNVNFINGLLFILPVWILLYVIIGNYRRIYRKSRLGEMGQSAVVSFIGTSFFFFYVANTTLLGEHKVSSLLFIIFCLLFFCINFLPRLIITSGTINKIHRRKIGFNTIIIGNNGNAVQIYKTLENQEIPSGNKLIGFVDVGKDSPYKIGNYLPHLGSCKDLNLIIREYKAEEVIIAIETDEQQMLNKIIPQIEDADLVVKIIPQMQDFLMGKVKVSSIFHAPLIQISPILMPAWQQSLKRIFDILVSITAMVLLIPFYFFTALGVKISSKGPVIYSQERIGYKGRPFMMHKFRSMYRDAEDGGPQLSSKTDCRITPFGRFIRKIRLDEIPQFYSVLKGDMSIVGPRPERQYYIDQIMERSPHYRLLLKVKPGITSWGQVKFGYASSVDEMIERLKYDILYIENMSLAVDFRILIYTVLIVIQGRGK